MLSRLAHQQVLGRETAGTLDELLVPVAEVAALAAAETQADASIRAEAQGDRVQKRCSELELELKLRALPCGGSSTWAVGLKAAAFLEQPAVVQESRTLALVLQTWDCMAMYLCWNEVQQVQVLVPEA